MEKNTNDTKSLIMLISSMLIYGSIGIFRRFIPLSSELLAFSRGLLGTIFILLFLLIKKHKLTKAITRKYLILLILSGALIGINWMLLFESYNYTTVPIATLCYYMEPTFVILLSPIVLKERLTLKKGLCAFVAILGMFFVSGVYKNGLSSGIEIKGILLGLCAALIYAIVIFINKKVFGVNQYEKTIIQLASAALIMVPYLFFTNGFTLVDLNVKALVLLLIVGLFHTGIAYTLYFGSIDGLKTSAIALFSYIDPVTALVLSAVILGERMSLAEIIGAVLILGAAYISEK